MNRYFKLNKDNSVICELLTNQLRFGRWVWKDTICTETYTHKPLTPEFFDSFTEIDSTEYNEIWGSKLNRA